MGETMILRVEDAQRILGVSRWMVYELIRRGELPVLRVGRLIRIPRPALEAWIEAQTKRPNEVA
jgi:excisionase family DNA binding protein